jgi:hypothetical protein
MLSLLERCFKDAFFCDFHHLAPRAAHSPFLASSVLFRLKSVLREMEMHGNCILYAPSLYWAFHFDSKWSLVSLVSLKWAILP